MKTFSTMLPLGTPAPSFTLPDVVTHQLMSFPGMMQAQGFVIMFICNHCPYVQYINTELVAVAKEYLKKNIVFLAINSNDIENYPADSPLHMQQTAKAEGYPFPYLFDESQAVAKAYSAACTPDFYVFDKDSLLVYRGQFDDSRPGNELPINGASLRIALNSLLNDQPILLEQKPSMGCNIKWKNNVL